MRLLTKLVSQITWLLHSPFSSKSSISLWRKLPAILPRGNLKAKELCSWSWTIELILSWSPFSSSVTFEYIALCASLTTPEYEVTLKLLSTLCSKALTLVSLNLFLSSAPRYTIGSLSRSSLVNGPKSLKKDAAFKTSFEEVLSAELSEVTLALVLAAFLEAPSSFWVAICGLITLTKADGI